MVSVAAGEGAAKGFLSISPSVPNPRYLPEVDLDLSDLDVRDAQNRPVSNASALANLQALFVDNWCTAARQPLLHLVDQTDYLLLMFSRLFNNVFFASVDRPIRRQFDALFSPKKHVVHHVEKLWISFVVDTSALRSANAGWTPLQALQRLPLRCDTSSQVSSVNQPHVPRPHERRL